MSALPEPLTCNLCEYRLLLEKSHIVANLLLRANITSALQQILWAVDHNDPQTVITQVRLINLALPKGV